MPFYRKKPVIIEAVRVSVILVAVRDKRLDLLPQWVQDGISKSTLGWGHHPEAKVIDRLYIDTLEGTMTGESADWLIKGINGELYPCKPDIFEKTYELADIQVRGDAE